MVCECLAGEESFSLLQWSPVHVPHQNSIKAETLRVFFFPRGKGTSLELLSYLLLSLTQHKSPVLEKVVAQVTLAWLWWQFQVFSQAGISCSSSGLLNLYLGNQYS